MLKDAKGRSQKRKKDKASKSSTAEEHVDVEAEGEPISSPKDVPAKRLRKEFAKKAQLIEQEAKKKKRRTQ